MANINIMHDINPMFSNKISYDLASYRSQRCISQIISKQSISPLTNSVAMNWSMQHIFNDIGHDVSTPFNHNIGIVDVKTGGSRVGGPELCV